MFPIVQTLSWSFRCLADKLHPLSRHDGGPWAASDNDRLAKAGAELAIRCCLLFVKGDWSEYATTFGLPTWHDGVRPCYMCNGSGPGLMRFDNASSTSFPFRENLEGEYAAACERCEIWAVLSRDAHTRVLEDLSTTTSGSKATMGGAWEAISPNSACWQAIGWSRHRSFPTSVGSMRSRTSRRQFFSGGNNAKPSADTEAPCLLPI